MEHLLELHFGAFCLHCLGELKEPVLGAFAGAAFWNFAFASLSEDLFGIQDVASVFGNGIEKPD